MAIKIRRAVPGILLAAVLTSAGCSLLDRYGRLSAPWFGGTQPPISELIDSFEKYRVFYAGISLQSPSAVLFDPRDDDRILTPEQWVEVTRKEDLRELVGWLEADLKYPPRLYKILGPGDRLFGYFYSPWNSLLLRVVDAQTMWVEDLPLPPIEYGGNEGKVAP